LVLCCATLASAGLRPPIAPASVSGHRTIAVNSTPHFTLKGQVGTGAQILWNLTDDVVGKITSISLNVQANVLVTGSTFTPLTQVSAIALDSGKVLSKAAPDSQFSYSTAVSSDASRTAVYGCAADTGKDCTLAVFKGTDASSTPIWREKIKGYMWWGAQGMKMSDDGSLVAVAALKELPEMFGLVPAVLTWLDGAGKTIGNYSMNLSIGEVWTNAKYVATREFNTETGFLRIFSTKTPLTNCSLEAQYVGLELSRSFGSIVQPYKDGVAQLMVVKQQSGGQQCSDNWQWGLPVDQRFLLLKTSDEASVLATLNGRTISFFVFPKNAAPPQPAFWSVDLPEDYPVDLNEGDIHFAFSTDGVHLGIGVAGLGVFYMNVQTSHVVHVYSHDNPCGILSIAIDPNPGGDVYLVADFNQLVSVSPTELDCMDGGDGLTAFKIPK